MAGHVLYMIWTRVSPSIEDDWTQWMNDVHIPNVASADGFLGGRTFKLHSDAAGLNYNYLTIYEVKSMEAFERYQSSDFADAMRQEVSDRYDDQLMSARTVLEAISS